MIAPKYYVKRVGDTSFIDVQDLYRGIDIEGRITGIIGCGKPKNIVIQEWVNDGIDEYTPSEICNELPSVEINFFFTEQYRTDDNDYDIALEHSKLVSDLFMGSSFELLDGYTNMSVRVKALEGYEPSVYNINQSVGNNIIVGSVKLKRMI